MSFAGSVIHSTLDEDDYDDDDFEDFEFANEGTTSLYNVHVDI